MTKHVIAIISVLKPVDDTRNYEKVAKSISNTNKYETNIIGFSTKRMPSHPNISFHPLFSFKRTGIKRLSASKLIWKKLLQLKPELIIVTTAELLIVSILYKIKFGGKIVYDVQENYFRNIAYTNTFPMLIRFPLAVLTRCVEYVSAYFIDKVILAEKVYWKQMSYLRHKAIILENKAVIPDNIREVKSFRNDPLKFVYSGTIADHYGIFDAIAFMKQLKSILANVELVIIGYAAQEKIFQAVKESIQRHDYIRLVGGDALVPHEQILMEIKQADFCLLPYQKNKSTAGCVPTKLFECLVMETPVIIRPNHAWNELIATNNAGIMHDFKRIDQVLLQKLTNTYYGNHDTSQYEWRQSASALIDVVQHIMA